MNSLNLLYEKTKDYHYLLMIDIFISILGFFSLLISEQQIWFLAFFFISISQLILHIFYLYKLEKKFITFPIVFFILSYVFHFGHLFITAFGFEFGNNVLFPLWYIKLDVYQKAAIFTLLSQMMLFFGLYFFMSQKLKKQDIVISKVKISLKYIRILGFVCFFIGIIPTLYIDISKLILFLDGGYTNTFNLNVHDFVEVIANFFNFSIFALLIGYSKNKKIANTIFFSAILYKVIMMSSGGRGEAIVFLLGLFIVWESLIMELSGKQIVILFLIGYLGLTFLNFIASVRNITEFNLVQIGNVFIDSLTDNQLINALSEFGSTFSAVCFTLNSNPGPTYGLNYIFPIILILPNIGGFNSKVVEQMIFTRHINTFDQPIGGSYIGELYYSFHWFGWIFAILLGILIGYISYKMMVSKKEKNYFIYLLSSYSTPLLFFWIRGYFGAIYREYTWHCGFAIFFMLVLYYIQKRKKGMIK